MPSTRQASQTSTVHCSCVKALWLAVSVLGCLLPAQQAAAQTEDGAVATFESQGVDEEVLTILESLGVRLVRHGAPPQGDSLSWFLAVQRMLEPLVLRVDSRAAMITVFRSSDGTALVRVLTPETFRTSPYVAALAAAELLGLLRQTPVAKVQPSPEGQPADAEPTPARTIHWVLSAGGELAASPRKDPVLWRPLLSAGAEIDFASTPYFGLVHLAAAPLGVWTRGVPGAQAGERVRYTRSDVGARLGVGKHVLAGSVLGYLSGGVGFVAATPRGVPADRARIDKRNQGFVGAGTALRYQPWQYVAFTFGIELTWLPDPVRYLVAGRRAIDEGALRVGSSFSLSLTLP